MRTRPFAGVDDDSPDTTTSVAAMPPWVIVGLCAAALTGGVICSVARPDAVVPVVVASVCQLVATASGLRSPRHPAVWAGVVAIVGLGTTLAHPVLSDLAYQGAQPWVGLASTAAIWTLYRHAEDWTTIIAGSAALVLDMVGLGAVGVRAGLPVATAVLAATVYLLVGVLIAFANRLGDARNDRLSRARSAVEVGDTSSPDVPRTDALAAARRALAIVVLRCDELVGATADHEVRRAAADLREVACRGITTGDASGIVRVEVHDPTIESATSTPAPLTSVTRTPAMTLPHMSDRDREVLRLVATGASNAAIARSLYLSEATVKQYVSKLMRRFDRENRTQLALMAARWFEDEPRPVDLATTDATTSSPRHG